MSFRLPRRENPVSGGSLTALSIAATILSGLPIALLGALDVLISADRELSTIQLGFVVAIFFATSAACSLPAGRLLERLGPIRTMEFAAVAIAIVLLWIGLRPWSYPELLLLGVVAGAANAASQIAVNFLLATRISSTRMGVAFGLKQASVPAGPLVAGLSVPIIGLTVGWPWAFALAAAFAAVVALAAALARTSRRPTGRPAKVEVRRHVPALAILSIAVALASAAGNTLGPFLVSAAVARGFVAADAGAMLAVGGLAAVVARILAGWAADRRAQEDSLTMVAILLGIGVLGFAILATATSPAVFAVGTVIAFAAGWGWAGLIWLSVARLAEIPPAAGMSVVQVGASGGGVLGPAVFGILAGNASYPLAWAVAGAAALVASILTIAARRILLPQLRSTRVHDVDRAGVA
jgi:MFS family permease